MNTKKILATIVRYLPTVKVVAGAIAAGATEAAASGSLDGRSLAVAFVVGAAGYVFPDWNPAPSARRRIEAEGSA